MSSKVAPPAEYTDALKRIRTKGGFREPEFWLLVVADESDSSGFSVLRCNERAHFGTYSFLWDMLSDKMVVAHGIGHVHVPVDALASVAKAHEWVKADPPGTHLNYEAIAELVMLEKTAALVAVFDDTVISSMLQELLTHHGLLGVTGNV